jgi:hypothetical protein
MIVPFEVKATVPVGIAAAQERSEECPARLPATDSASGVTVAVNVTAWPKVDGFRLEVTVVVVDGKAGTASSKTTPRPSAPPPKVVP